MTREYTESGAPAAGCPQTSALFNDAYEKFVKGLPDMPTTLPNQPARPGDPHYVGQAEWDTHQGLLDLNTGKFCQGESSVNSAIADLGKEKTMIDGAQTGGTTAAQDILSNSPNGVKNAETELTKVIAGLKDNGFNAADSKDFSKALAALKDTKDPNSTWQAEEDIAKAEKVLNNRSERVSTASSDLTTGLKDFNSGDFKEGEQDMRNGMKQLYDKHHPKVNPGGPRWPEMTAGGPV